MRQVGRGVSDDDEEMDEPGELLVEVVADRALVAQTRLGEDYRVGVEWVGRCWVWLTVGEAPSLMEVVVSEARGRQAAGAGPGATRPGDGADYRDG